MNEVGIHLLSWCLSSILIFRSVLILKSLSPHSSKACETQLQTPLVLQKRPDSCTYSPYSRNALQSSLTCPTFVSSSVEKGYKLLMTLGDCLKSTEDSQAIGCLQSLKAYRRLFFHVKRPTVMWYSCLEATFGKALTRTHIATHD